MFIHLHLPLYRKTTFSDFKPKHLVLTLCLSLPKLIHHNEDTFTMIASAQINKLIWQKTRIILNRICR